MMLFYEINPFLSIENESNLNTLWILPLTVLQKKNEVIDIAC